MISLPTDVSADVDYRQSIMASDYQDISSEVPTI